MLVLSRERKQTIVFPGLELSVTILSIKRNRVKLGIMAPADVQIFREEIVAANRTGSSGQVEEQPASVQQH